MNLLTTHLRTGLTVAAMVALLGLVTAAYFHGRSSGWDAHVVVCEADKRAIEEANNKAIRTAQERYLREVDRILLENERLENDLETLSEDAAADPRARECGISADGVRRLDAIR